MGFHDVVDGIIINLVATDGGVVISFCALFTAVNKQGFLKVVSLLGFIGDTKETREYGVDYGNYGFLVLGSYLGVTIRVGFAAESSYLLVKAKTIIAVQI